MKLTVIAWDIYASMIIQAVRHHDDISLSLFSSKNVESSPEEYERALESLFDADIVFLYRSGESFWDELELSLEKLYPNKPVICVSSNPSFWTLSNMPFETVSTCYDYLLYGGMENITNLLHYLKNCFNASEPLPEGPKPIPWNGIYHPDYNGYATDVESYLTWYKHSSNPLVAIVFSRSYWVNDNCEMVDSLVYELEKLNLGCIPIFTYAVSDKKDSSDSEKSNDESIIDTYCIAPDGNVRIDAMIKMTSLLSEIRQSENPMDSRDGNPAYRKLNVPVFQPVLSPHKSEKEWREDPHGLGSLTSWYITMPEFEGVIEPLMLASASQASTADGTGSYKKILPLDERAHKIASRVKSWITLKKTPAHERRVAFILHNKPCASVEATVGGAAHLDSLESVVRILRRMSGHDYRVNPPEMGNDLAEMITDKKAISEFRWTTVDEIISKGGCLKEMPVEEYRSWFDGLSDSFKERITGVWGNPPGEEIDSVPPAMVHDNKIVITGLDFGNALVCVQPKRGCAGTRCDGKVCKILHDPDLPPPHQYFATYRYIENDFKAHCIIHVGTHGNLEFLPGKGVALSGDCCPDLAIGSMPHLYIYNADNPPEGAIAKRRSYATLIDHLQAVMTRSGLSDELEELDRLLGEYQEAKAMNKTRAHQLEHLIMDALEKTNLHHDIHHSHDTSFDETVVRIHETLSLIRNSQMNDGMHIFGEIPEGERRHDYIRSVMRSVNEKDLSLRTSVCSCIGIDVAYALKNQGQHCELLNMSYGKALDLCDDIALAFITEITTHPDREAEEVIVSIMGSMMQKSANSEEFDHHKKVILDIHNRIEESHEIESLLSGFNAEHIPAGPSGKVTRGRYDIMPTGRNFFTLDTRALPTRAAHRVGIMLADSLIEKHLNDNNALPENVAHYWTCMDITCADGEGMAQIMHLAGARPTWSAGGRVTGFEIIPLKELGRPRIDATIRVGGINRDTFPECVSYIDDVMRAVAALDEPPELNFVRKHALEQLKDKQDKPEDEAWDEAATRIFGSKPGTYMAGVNLAVYASAWKDENDLADVFIFWNQYAYGRKYFGRQAASDLVSNLKTVDVTFNKTYTDEYDLFGCCCYFSTHGGMTAAAKSLSGKDVKAYYGDTRDTENVGVRELSDEVRRVVRSKLLNPKWIEGMKKHGYKGLGDISKIIGRVFGWEATTEAVDDWIFDDITRTFVLDEEMNRAFEEHNPWALEEIGRRLLEANQRGLWDADPEVLDELKKSYMDIEGWLEDKMGDTSGDMQGGNVDIITPEEISSWQKQIHSLRHNMRSGK